MSEELKPQSVPEVKLKRPLLLTILCILTFAGSGLNFISSLLISVFYDAFRIAGGDLAKTMGIPEIAMILNASPLFFVASFLIYALAAFGAYQMWNLHQLGFHLYTIAQVLLILSTMYFYRLPAPSLADITFSAMFVLLYAYHLKYMIPDAS